MKLTQLLLVSLLPFAISSRFPPAKSPLYSKEADSLLQGMSRPHKGLLLVVLFEAPKGVTVPHLHVNLQLKEDYYVDDYVPRKKNAFFPVHFYSGAIWNKIQRHNPARYPIISAKVTQVWLSGSTFIPLEHYYSIKDIFRSAEFFEEIQNGREISDPSTDSTIRKYMKDMGYDKK